MKANKSNITLFFVFSILLTHTQKTFTYNEIDHPDLFVYLDDDDLYNENLEKLSLRYGDIRIDEIEEILEKIGKNRATDRTICNTICEILTLPYNAIKYIYQKYKR